MEIVSIHGVFLSKAFEEKLRPNDEEEARIYEVASEAERKFKEVLSEIEARYQKLIGP
ncbi:MAG: hypothetical protein Q7K26_00695 [bacterium]|nr:hypothetical protein [bacterium]